MIIDKEDLQRDRTAKEIAERFGVCDKTVQALWKTGTKAGRWSNSGGPFRFQRAVLMSGPFWFQK